MNIFNITRITNWNIVKDATLNTVGKRAISDDVSTKLKIQLLYSEHSPIRLLNFKWTWKNIKYWTSVHFSRHKIGIEHFVKTQRSDRTGEERDNKSQDALVDHMCTCNAQALINISRKRLCMKASLETRQAWQAMIDELKIIDPETACVLVPECVYRGFCPEPECCGYENTIKFNNIRMNYVQRCKDARGNK